MMMRRCSLFEAAAVVLALASVLLGVLWLRRGMETRKREAGRQAIAAGWLAALAHRNWERFQFDTDGNGIRDYETTDVAALCRLTARSSPDDDAGWDKLAKADFGTLGIAAVPLEGYLFGFISIGPDCNAYNPATGFAVCAWPADAYDWANAMTLFTDEKGIIWFKKPDASVAMMKRGLDHSELKAGGWKWID